MSDPRLERPEWRGRTNVDAFTIACLEHAEHLCGHEHVVTQGSYQAGDGDPNSAGTHDLGGVVDLRWTGRNVCVLNLRKAGMFAWHRTPQQGPWPDHIHAGVLGHPLLAPLAEAQETDYLNRRNGLANHGPDDGPRLNPIPRPVWPWPPDWTDMATKEELAGVVADQIRAAIPIIVEAVLAAQVDDDPAFNVKTALRRAGQPKEEI